MHACTQSHAAGAELSSAAICWVQVQIDKYITSPYMLINCKKAWPEGSRIAATGQLVLQRNGAAFTVCNALNRFDFSC